jgi:hypothetical protein
MAPVLTGREFALPSASTTITAWPSGESAPRAAERGSRPPFGLRETDAGEGAGQQLAPRVGELGAQQHRAGAGIDGEVGEAQRALFADRAAVLEQQRTWPPSPPSACRP